MRIYLVSSDPPGVATSTSSIREVTRKVTRSRNRCHRLSAMKSWIEQTQFGWKGRVMLAQGRTRSKTFATQRDAKAWLRRTITEISDGSFVPEASGKISLNA